MKKIPVIIDTDPGIDDAVALGIALFSPQLDVRLITTVCGNVGVDKTTANALRLMKFYGARVPVARGASEPLLVPFVDASDIHGVSGLEGFDFEEDDAGLLCRNHAVEEMRRLLLESGEKITLLPIGPLTNIALLLRMYPEVKPCIERLVLMGGGLGRGNKTVLAEFNIATDPEAAKIVFNSGLDITAAPLDVGLKALVLPEVSEKIAAMNKTGAMFKALFKKYRGGTYESGLHMYDSCVIAWLCRPEMFTAVKTFADVDVSGGYAHGCTIFDLADVYKKKPNMTVCVDLDTGAFVRWFEESIARCV